MEVVGVDQLSYYAAYYKGCINALLTARDRILVGVKGNERIYMDAEFKLATSSMQNCKRFMLGDSIRFRNHKKKSGKLISVEAYFAGD